MNTTNPEYLFKVFLGYSSSFKFYGDLVFFYENSQKKNGDNWLSLFSGLDQFEYNFGVDIVVNFTVNFENTDRA